MKRTVLGLGIASVLAFMPVAASAAVKLNIEDKVLDPTTAGMQFVDLIFEATGANETTVNEQLAFYDLGVRLVKVRGGNGGGVQFVTPFVGKPTDNFVFPDNAAIDIVQDETTSTFAFANVDANSASNFDITTGKKAARLFFQVDPATPADAVYEFRFDRDYTTISAGAGDDPNIVTDLSDAGVITFPEPGSLSVLAIGGLLALRRRRTA